MRSGESCRSSHDEKVLKKAKEDVAREKEPARESEEDSEVDDEDFGSTDK